MKSRAHFKSHPIHPILVAFPIAFFTGGVIFDLAGHFLERETLAIVAGYMIIAGIIGGLAAAVPGIIDYTYTIPPHSSAKKRGATHGLINTVVLIVFLTSWLLRSKEEVSPMVVLGLELVGMALLSISGWLGGTLVYRNQIGVDIRYADAGKWQERTLNKHKGKIEVAAYDELEINQMKLLRLRGKRIVLARTEESYVAFEDHCSHKGGSLAGGSMMCGTVQCPWHGSQFDVTSGEVKAGPAKKKIHVYKVEVEDQKVYLVL